MKFSLLDFFSWEFSTSSSIFETVDSPNAFVTFTRIMPERFTEPLIISLPSFTFLGIDSPVSAEVSTVEAPDTTTPSRGTFSPGFITITLPHSTSSGSTFSSSPISFSILA